jgi:hypothetical protein
VIAEPSTFGAAAEETSVVSFVSAACANAALCLLFWGISNCQPVLGQERNVSVVLPELQYARHCSSEITLHNVSARFVDVAVVGHKSNGAIVGLMERKTNRIRVSPSEYVQVRLQVQDDVAWAEVIEAVPQPRLRPVLSISAFTECLDGNELLTEPREIAPLIENPKFSVEPSASPAPAGTVLLVINASDKRMNWIACYSAGTTVSNGEGEMIPLCSERLERVLAPYQSWRLVTTLKGNPLVRFRATGEAVAMQLLTPSALQVQMYKVESTIRFDLK